MRLSQGVGLSLKVLRGTKNAAPLKTQKERNKKGSRKLRNLKKKENIETNKIPKYVDNIVDTPIDSNNKCYIL
jgi:hypothetical protein